MMAIEENGIKVVGYLVVSLVALGIYFLIFELRYMWYLGTNDSAVLRGGSIACTLAIVGLWVFFPSPILVAVIAFFGLIFPPFYDRNAFAMVDLRFVGFMLLGVGLLVAVTYLWRNTRVLGAAAG